MTAAVGAPPSRRGAAVRPPWGVSGRRLRVLATAVTGTPVATSGLAIPSLVANRVQVIAGGNDVSFFGGVAKGTFNVREIAPAGSCTVNNFELLTAPGSPINKPSDLVGRTISVPSTASINTLLINQTLKEDSVNPGSVHFVDIAFDDAQAALLAHRVDVISVIEPFLTQLSDHAGPDADPAGDQPDVRVTRDQQPAERLLAAVPAGKRLMTGPGGAAAGRADAASGGAEHRGRSAREG
jgi:ABC-type amino acid transport substrate-binding protein